MGNEPPVQDRVRAAYEHLTLDVPLEAIERRATRRRRYRRRAALLAAATVFVAVLVSGLALWQTAPPAIATVALPDGTEIAIVDLFEPDKFETLAEELGDHGVELLIREVPVAQAADRRVLGVQFPKDARVDDSTHTMQVAGPLHEPVVVTVGDASLATGETTAGLLLHEVFPEISAAIDRCDPERTAAALGDLGFTVDWVLIEFLDEGGPTASTRLDGPRPGDVILHVGRGPDRWVDGASAFDQTWIDPSHRALLIELVDGPENADGHPLRCD